MLVNPTSMQANVKIVYYGPGLCGKTTNLQWIHRKIAPKSRGEMVSLETQTDRTLFFDLLPLDVGVVGGLKVLLQLYTVPGQVFYNATRKLVLKGVDGVVFVADSQEAVLEANTESLQNLYDNLAEQGCDVSALPMVFQLNKRDLRDILPAEKLTQALGTRGLPVYEAAALHGVGVFETLKGICRVTINDIRESARSASDAVPRRPAGRSATSTSAAVPASPVAVPSPPATPVAPPTPHPPTKEPVAPTPHPPPVEPAAPTPNPPPVEPVAPSSYPATAEPVPPRSYPATVQAAPPEPAGHDSLEQLVGAVPPVEFAVNTADGSEPHVLRTRLPVDIQRELETLRVQAQAPAQPPRAKLELRRRATIEVPAMLLEGCTTLNVHLGLAGQGGGEQLLRDVANLKLDAGTAMDQLTLHLELELKGQP